MRYHYYVMCDYICCFQLQIWKFYRYVVIIPSFTLLYVFSGEAGYQLIDWPNRHGQWHIEMPYFWAPIRWRVYCQEELPAEGLPSTGAEGRGFGRELPTSSIVPAPYPRCRVLRWWSWWHYVRYANVSMIITAYARPYNNMQEFNPF